MPISIVPAAVSRVVGETRRASHCPSSTPIRLVLIKAVPAPRKTIQGAWDWALMSSVVTWVLSPSSAKKMVMNVEPKTRQKAARLKVEDLASTALEAGGRELEIDTIG